MGDAVKQMKQSVPEMVAPLVVYLCTDQAANVNGYDFEVGGGKIGVFSQPEVTAKIEKAGIWTLDELMDIMPQKITKGLVNPVPPQP
jgi:hypothetical protein